MCDMRSRESQTKIPLSYLQKWDVYKLTYNYNTNTEIENVLKMVETSILSLISCVSAETTQNKFEHSSPLITV